MSSKVTQEDIYEFMSDMAQEMRDENLPIVNYIVHDFPGLENADQIKSRKDKNKRQEYESNIFRDSDESFARIKDTGCSNSK